MLPNDQMTRRFYQEMRLIRRVEEEIERVYPTDKVKSPVHLSIGQEAPSVGVCAALRRSDVVFATYRGHAAYLAKGGDLRAMIAELYGKATGCAGGKAGSMHLIDLAAGVMGMSAIVATTIPHAVGYALAEKMRGRDTATVAFFGDGAQEEGVFHESMNFAALRKLPVLFVCENNAYAIYTPLHKRVPEPNYVERAWAYRVPGQRVEGGDIFAIHQAAQAAVDHLRRGDGPYYLEIETMRWAQHVGPGESPHPYRPDGEVARWQARDPLARLAQMLGNDATAAIDAEVEARISDAFAFADDSPLPDDASVYEDVLA